MCVCLCVYVYIYIYIYIIVYIYVYTSISSPNYGVYTPRVISTHPRTHSHTHVRAYTHLTPTKATQYYQYI